jgi:hypothetical protein
VNRRLLLLAAVLVLLLFGGWATRQLATPPAARTAAPPKKVVIAGTEAANHAVVEGTPGPRELGLPPLDTAAESTQDTCTVLRLSHDKLRINQDMLGHAQGDTVEAARLRAMVERQERAIRRLSARAARSGLTCE